MRLSIRSRVFAIGAILLGVSGCGRKVARPIPLPSTVPEATEAAGPSTESSGIGDTAAPPAIEAETVAIEGDEPVFVIRGGRGPERMVFLHGMCGHSLGYVQSFQNAAAQRGVLVGVQGDVSCGGPWRSWGGDLRKLDARIDAAFRAVGAEIPPGGEVVGIGYSMGATRIESLAAMYPDKYTRVILMGAPSTPSVTHLRHVRSAVMMAGERDRQDKMRAGAKLLTAEGIPSVYIPIPGATHGSMGGSPEDPERVMAKALDTLFSIERTTPREDLLCPEPEPDVFALESERREPGAPRELHEVVLRHTVV
jgi:predicted esterase